jgi:hypothetical protein
MMNRNQALYFGMIALVVGLCIGIVSNAQSATAATKSALQPGQASGALTVGDSTVKLSNAGVFVDKKDERKPTVLVLSDQELPLSGWADSSDMIMFRMEHKFNGVAFWLDEKHEVFRTEYYMPGHFPAGASGMFELKLDAGKSLSGAAVSTDAAAKQSDPIKLDTRFNAAVK